MIVKYEMSMIEKSERRDCKHLRCIATWILNNVDYKLLKDEVSTLKYGNKLESGYSKKYMEALVGRSTFIYAVHILPTLSSFGMQGLCFPHNILSSPLKSGILNKK